MGTDDIDLLSVGVDVGSATSHLVFSRLKLKRDDASVSRRFLIQDRNVVYQGRIIDTPLLDDQRIDVDRLTDFLKEEYRLAGIEPGDVQTGAVIITGETAKKRNAEQIVAALSHEAGKFVAAAAGPNFESLIAAMGSGARQRSKQTGKTILSCDIGGGTANMAIVVKGRILSTGCVAVGGRLLAVNGQREIWRIAEAAKHVMADLGVEYGVGDRISEDQVDRIAEKFAHVLLEVITGPAASDLARTLMVTGDLDFTFPIDEYMFSGGVAEWLYGKNGHHPGHYHDMGPILAEKLRALTGRLDAPVVEPLNKIRATVIGAGAHTLAISGSSGFMDDKLTFPIKNVPVVQVDVEREKLSVPYVVSRIAAAFQRLDRSEGDTIVALYFEDPVVNSYPKLTLFAKSIEQALSRSRANDLPIILIFGGDIACSVGNVIRRETALKRNLLTLDELDLKAGDWIDIGAPLVDNQVFPVTVKSLAFQEQARP